MPQNGGGSYRNKWNNIVENQPSKTEQKDNYFPHFPLNSALKNAVKIQKNENNNFLINSPDYGKVFSPANNQKNNFDSDFTFGLKIPNNKEGISNDILGLFKSPKDQFQNDWNLFNDFLGFRKSRCYLTILWLIHLIFIDDLDKIVHILN